MKRLLREVMEDYCRGTRSREDWVRVGSPRVRKTGHVYRIRSSAFPTDAAVKIFLCKEKGHQHARRLHRALERYSPSDTIMQHVAAPYALVENRRAVIMEWIDAPPLQRAIHGFPGERIGRHEAVKKSAEWLRWFHLRDGIANSPFDANAALHRIDALFARIPAERRCATFEASSALLYRRADIVHGQAVMHGSVHGDFTPYNIMVSRATAVGIDYLANKQVAVVGDVNRMLMYLFAHRYFPVSRRMLGPQGCTREDWTAFTQGYGTGILPAGEQTFLYFQFLEVMRRWGSLLAETEPPSILFRYIETNRVRTMAQHIAHLLS
ncbi:MAG: phosphotransferase [Gammaproteobacteria bacterium]|nr:phosphotransferase [Gammaproteobacteria bacterium]